MNLITYHVSNETPIVMQTFQLGKVLEACIQCAAFVVGFNVLEIANDYNKVLLALTMKDGEENKKAFELLTGLKLIKVEGESDEQK